MSIGIQFYFIMVTQFATKIFAFAASVLVARVMGPTVVGIIAFAYAFVGLFEFLFDMGTGTAHIKRISEGRDFSRCLGAYALLKALLSLFALGIILAVFGLFYQYREGFQDQAQRIVIYIILGSVVIDQGFMYIFNTFKAQLKFGKSQIVKSVKDVTDALLVICVVLFWRNIYVLASVYLASEILGTLLGFFLLSNRRIAWPGWKLLKSYVSFSIPMFAVTVSWTVYQNIDKVMIRSFWPASDVGVYHVAYRICAYALLLGTSLNAILFPTISKLQGKRDDDSITNVLYKAERLLSLLISPFALLLIVFAKPIVISIWGIEYLQTISILRVLSIFSLFACLNSTLSAGIMGLGNIWVYFWLFFINVILVMLLNVILIPQNIFGIQMLGMGALGAAWGTVLSVAIGYIIRKTVLRDYMKLGMTLRVLSFPLIAMAVAGVIWVLTRFEISLSQAMYLLPLTFAGYFILLFISKTMTVQDVRYIVKMLNPHTTREYLLSEFAKTTNDEKIDRV